MAEVGFLLAVIAAPILIGVGDDDAMKEIRSTMARQMLED